MAPIGKFSGVTKTEFGRVDDILAANIAGIDNINLVLEEIVDDGVHKSYSFNTDRGCQSIWRPINPLPHRS